MQGIELRDVRKTYGDVDALDGVSLTIAPGTFHCIVGPNGSGKTTLFDLLLGLTRPSAGTIDRPDGPIGYSFQHPNFYPDLTVAENCSVFGDIAGVDDDGWVETVQRELGLDRVSHRLAGDLSGGFQKKLDLALAFVKRPPFAILDEPLDNLDDVSQHRLFSFLDDYRSDDRTVVVATHRVGEFEPYVDHMTVLDEGTVVFDGRLSEETFADRNADSPHELYLELVT